MYLLYVTLQQERNLTQAVNVVVLSWGKYVKHSDLTKGWGPAFPVSLLQAQLILIPVFTSLSGT